MCLAGGGSHFEHWWRWNQLGSRMEKRPEAFEVTHELIEAVHEAVITVSATSV